MIAGINQHAGEGSLAFNVKDLTCIPAFASNITNLYLYANVHRRWPQIRNHLCASYPTSTTVKKDFESKQLIKEEQVRFLKALTDTQNFLISDMPEDWIYLTEGGESKVYLHSDQLNVIKLNDATYYATWLEYFNSLVIHNLLFPETAYTFLGFIEKQEVLFAVLKQAFVASEETADLNTIRELLEFNGFENSA
jgi:hypothetical protein